MAATGVVCIVTSDYTSEFILKVTIVIITQSLSSPLAIFRWASLDTRLNNGPCPATPITERAKAFAVHNGLTTKRAAA
jgi:hypothetical protein